MVGPAEEGTDAQSERLVGERIGGRYLVVRALGRGGMGTVYEARTDEGESFALKVIRPEVHQKVGHDAVRRFLREAKAAEQIASPYVALVVDAASDEERGLPFLVMELLHGRDLARLLQERGPLEPEGIVPLFVEACAGLAAAHACGVIHRDIKPANIFVQDVEGGRVAAKICDFGVAKQMGPLEEGSELTHSGGIVGSPMYMSPEQARSAKAVDHRTDIFSLAVSLYEALTGVRPWQASSVGQMVFAMWSTEPRPLGSIAPWVDPKLAAVIHHALARAPDQRIPTAEAFGAALAPFGKGPLALTSLRAVSPEHREQLTVVASSAWTDIAIASTIPTTGGTPPVPTLKSPQRGRSWPIPVAVAAVLAVSAGVVWSVHARPPAKWWADERATIAVPIAQTSNGDASACEAWFPRAIAEGVAAELVAGGKVRALGPQALAEIYGVPTAAGSTLKGAFGVDAIAEMRCERDGDTTRVRVRVVSTETPPRELSSFRASGSSDTPSALATNVTEKLRSSLGLAEPPADELARASHPLPASPAATRDYVEGLVSLETFHTAAARDSLTRVVAAEPTFVPAHQALAAALAASGRQSDAARESELAAKSAVALPNEDRLVAEGDAEATAFRWDKAMDTYRAVVRVFPDRTDVALKLVRLLVATARGREAREALDALVSAEPRTSQDPRVKVACAQVDATLGEYPKAVEEAARARSAAGAEGLPRVEMDAASAGCIALRHLADVERSANVCEAALELAQKLGDRNTMVANLAGVAYLAAIRGKLDEANAALDRALAIAEQEENDHLRTLTLNTRANILKRRGDLVATLAVARASLAAADAGGNARDRTTARIMIAGTLLDSGVIDEAGRYYQEGLEICRASGDNGSRAIILQNLGTFWTEKGDITRAAASAAEALSIQEAIGDEFDLPWTLDELGEIEIAAGEPGKARGHLESAIALRTKLKLPTVSSREDLSQALSNLGDHEAALREARTAVQDADAGSSASLQVEVRLALAGALVEADKPVDALAVIDRAVELSRASGSTVDKVYPMQARALFLAGRTRDALDVTKTPLTEPFAQREMRLVVDEIAIARGQRDRALHDLQALASEAHASGHGQLEREANALIAKSGAPGSR